MEKQYQYNSVEEALEELRRGRIVLVTDDPDRENVLSLSMMKTGKMKEI